MKRQIKQQENEEELMEIRQDSGDFFERCFPRVYEYFIKQRDPSRYNKEGMDNFDNFIVKKVGFLRYLAEQYYKNKKIYSLQLSKLVDDTLLEHLDYILYEYIDEGSDKKYEEAKDFFYFLIEKALVRIVLKQ